MAGSDSGVCRCGGKEGTEETVVLQEESNEAVGKQDAGEKEKTGEDRDEMIVVYVCGSPKRRCCDASCRKQVYQAIEMAGGVTEEAEASWLNLAEVLTDGARIYVPDKEEVSGANGWKEPKRIPGAAGGRQSQPGFQGGTDDASGDR